jgi:hypothetical protein
VKIERVTPEIPAEIRKSPAIPEPPRGDVTQADVAGYILDLTERLEACRDRHRTLVNLIDAEKDD